MQGDSLSCAAVRKCNHCCATVWCPGTLSSHTHPPPGHLSTVTPLNLARPARHLSMPAHHLEPQFPVYAWNMHGIYNVHVDLLHMHGIYMIYSWIYNVYPSDWIYMVYPWIYYVYPPSIYMVYHWMYIHGIYVVYCGISMDISSFLNPDFAAGQCC